MAWSKTGNIKGPKGDAGSGTGASGIPIRPTQTGLYTFVLADANTCTPFTLDGARIPANSDVPFDLGTRLYVQQKGTSSIALGGSAGVIVQIAGDNGTYAQGEWLCAIKTDTDTWIVYPFIAAGFRSVNTADDSLNTLLLLPHDGDLIRVPLTNNVTGFTVAPFPGTIQPAALGMTFALRFRQDNTGGRTVAFPSSFKFMAGSDTQVQLAPNVYTMLVGTTFDNFVRVECVMKACGV